MNPFQIRIHLDFSNVQMALDSAGTLVSSRHPNRYRNSTFSFKNDIFLRFSTSFNAYISWLFYMNSAWNLFRLSFRVICLWKSINRSRLLRNSPHFSSLARDLITKPSGKNMAKVFKIHLFIFGMHSILHELIYSTYPSQSVLT